MQGRWCACRRGGCGRDEGPVAELPRMPRHLGRSCVGVSVSRFLQSVGRSLTEGLRLALVHGL